MTIMTAVTTIGDALRALVDCRHGNTSRVFTELGAYPRKHYIVCLTCGRRLEYCLDTMRSKEEVADVVVTGR